MKSWMSKKSHWNLCMTVADDKMKDHKLFVLHTKSGMYNIFQISFDCKYQAFHEVDILTEYFNRIWLLLLT